MGKNVFVYLFFFVASIIALTMPVLGEQTTIIHPTLPGSNFRDYSKSSTIIDGNMAYKTLPGSNFRDYRKPGIKIDGDMLYPTLPGSIFRDYTKPGTKIVGNMLYPTLPGSSFRDYTKPGMKMEGDRAYATLPGSDFRDVSKPRRMLDGNLTYPSLPGSNFRDYSKPGRKSTRDFSSLKPAEKAIHLVDIHNNGAGGDDEVCEQDKPLIQSGTQKHEHQNNAPTLSTPEANTTRTPAQCPKDSERGDILYIPLPQAIRE